MLPLDPVTLSSDGVRLEPLGLEHVEALVLAAAESRANYAFTLVPPDLASMRAYVSAAVDLRQKGLALPFATVDAIRGKVVGSTRFANLEVWTWPGDKAPGEPAVPFDAAEIGWTWLAASAQRTPVNTTAKLLMLTHAFEVWKVRRVNLKTDDRNARSRAAIERLGAKLDGVLRSHMPAYSGGIRDTALYSILAAEWPSVKAGLEARLARAREARV
jgi:RimJ/RimL family protein N-acetyltransferase